MPTLALMGHLGLGPRQGAWKAKDKRRWVLARVRRALVPLAGDIPAHGFRGYLRDRVNRYCVALKERLVVRSGPGKRGRPVVRDAAELARFLGVSIREGASLMEVISVWLKEFIKTIQGAVGVVADRLGGGAVVLAVDRVVPAWPRYFRGLLAGGANCI